MIQLCEVEHCTGCAACANVCTKGCISMEPSIEGFLYPNIDYNKCIECGLCQKVCPMLNDIHKQTATCAYAAWSFDETIRKSSSSGGVFSIIASYIINHGGIVYGCVLDKNMNAVHQRARTCDELIPMRGSKYVQSDISYVYQNIISDLKLGRIVLFTGTPCQCAAIKSVTRGIGNLITIDIVCHGVPSNKVFKSYVSKLNSKYGIIKPESFKFRDFENWKYSISFECDAGFKRLNTKESIYIPMFINGLLTRESCFNCKFTTPARATDITIADFWGLGSQKPFKYDITNGCSMILTNTEKGQDLLSKVETDLFIEKREFNEAISNNSQLHKQPTKPLRRNNAIEYFLNHTLDELYKEYIPFKSRIRILIKKSLGLS